MNNYENRPLSSEEVEVALKMFSQQRLTLESLVRDLEKSHGAFGTTKGEQDAISKKIANLEQRLDVVIETLDLLEKGWDGQCLHCKSDYATGLIVGGGSCLPYCPECLGALNHSRRKGTIHGQGHVHTGRLLFA